MRWQDEGAVKRNCKEHHDADNREANYFHRKLFVISDSKELSSRSACASKCKWKSVLILLC